MKTLKDRYFWIGILIAVALACCVDVHATCPTCSNDLFDDWSFDKDGNSTIHNINYTHVNSPNVQKVATFMGNGIKTVEGSNGCYKYAFRKNYSMEHDFSLNFWLNATTGIGGIETILDFQGPAGGNGWVIRNQGNPTEFNVLLRAGTALTSDDIPVNYGKWDMFTITWDNSTKRLNVSRNGGLVYTAQKGSAYVAGNTPFFIGCQYDATLTPSMVFDQMDIWGRLITKAEITSLNNSGLGLPYASWGTPASLKNLSIPQTSPPTNKQYNTNPIVFRGNVTTNETGVVCGLNVNTVQVVNKTLAGTFVTFSRNFSASSNNTWYVQCNHIGSSWKTYQANSTEKYFYYDAVNPAIVSTFKNNSFFLQNGVGARGTKVKASFNFSDDFMLFKANVSIDGIKVKIITDLNSTTYKYNLSYNSTKLTKGPHRLKALCSDGHTSNLLTDTYRVTQNTNYLKYEYSNKAIQIQNKDFAPGDVFTTTKQTDRYIWTFNPAIQKGTYTFVVTTADDLHIVNKPETPYKSWIITGDKWIDFYLTGKETVSIKRLTSKSAEVTVGGITSNPQYYHSIGELNTFTKTWDFMVGNSTEAYGNNLLEGQPIRLNLTLTTGSGLFGRFNASLVWGGHTYSFVPKVAINASNTFFQQNLTTTGISTLNASKEHYWFLNYTFLGSTVINTTKKNQSLFATRIDNCTVAHTPSLNFTLLKYPTLARTSGNLYYLVNYGNIFGIRRNYTLADLGRNITKMCIYPSWTAISADWRVQFNSPGYTGYNYFTINTTMNSSTKRNINLYLMDNATQIVFQVNDLNDNGVNGAYITMLAYNPTTGNYDLVSQLKTDYLGYAVGNGVLNTQWYKFIVTYGGVVKLETSPTILLTTSRVFRIDTSAYSFLTRFTNTDGILRSLTYNNNTRTFSFTFVDTSATIQAGCLRVVRRDGTQDSQLVDKCVNATSGVLTYTHPVMVGQNTFLATGYVHFDEVFTLETLLITIGKIFQIFEGEGLFLTFMIILTVGLVGMFSPGIAIILTVVAVIFTNLLGIYVMNGGYLILFIILGGIAFYKIR